MNTIAAIILWLWSVAAFSSTAFAWASLISSPSSRLPIAIAIAKRCEHFHLSSYPSKASSSELSHDEVDHQIHEEDEVEFVSSQRHCKSNIIHLECGFPRDDIHHKDQQYQTSTIRRKFLSNLLVSSTTLISNTLANPTPSIAANNDEFEAPMNDLTKQIRTSVVRGAQLIDKVDGKWERFSDDLGLGKERNKPKRNVIDAGGNQLTKKVVRSEVLMEGEIVWDDKFVFGLLQLCDEAFLSSLKSQQSQSSITKSNLIQQIDETKQLLRKSFFSSSTPSLQDEFNFDCYTHFKVYNEILIKHKVTFPPFRKEFESLIGKSLLQLVMQQQLLAAPSSTATNLDECLKNALRTTDAIATLLQKKGLVSSWERPIPLDDDIEDFTTTTLSSTDNFSVSSDLPYSLALNGDISLNSQLLLQELGYRLYPSFGRWLVQEGVSQCFTAGIDEKISVQIDDYYMDTSYNSNPDLFEVKQVLLNIVIQRD